MTILRPRAEKTPRHQCSGIRMHQEARYQGPQGQQGQKTRSHSPPDHIVLPAPHTPFHSPLRKKATEASGAPGVHTELDITGERATEIEILQ